MIDFNLSLPLKPRSTTCNPRSLPSSIGSNKLKADASGLATIDNPTRVLDAFFHTDNYAPVICRSLPPRSSRRCRSASASAKALLLLLASLPNVAVGFRLTDFPDFIASVISF
ncbi:hypothetical protein KSP40_PGU020936 [Platanthera guangdongensis]|uniref:Uncharacterized protein n=1 Tax=Platanthera guangdongensis TaxID=2320717 RepID=A0ABR2MCS7_9ASPA